MKTLISLTALLGFVVGCTSQQDIQKAIEAHPEWVFSAIEKNPQKFAEVLQKATVEARKQQQAKAEEDARKEMEDDLKNPKQPKIADDRAALGPKDAPILIVEYSDFQCPFCQRGYETVKKLKQKHGDKIRLVFKHFPLSFHPQAMPAAQYFEAIALQSPEKAYQFHDYVFENQNKLGDGDKFLEAAAKKVGANVAKVKADLNSDKVKKNIAEDMEEANKFGITGTPGFVVSGVVVRGAYPIEHFEDIISKKMASK